MRQRQTGVLVFITPIILLLIVMFGALMLDGARLYSMRQSMQSEVNAAATAAANAAQGCGGPSVTLQGIKSRALIAARAQGFDGQDSQLVVEPGVLESGEGKVLSFTPTPANIARSNGVAVTYTKQVPVSMLLPENIFGTVTLSAKAAARKELIATLSAAGSTAVLGGTQQTANVLNTVLGAVLNNGNPFSLDPTDLSSLAETTVRLGDLLTDLGVDSVDQLLSKTVEVGALLTQLKGVLVKDSADGQCGQDGGCADVDTAVAAIDELLSGTGLLKTIQLADVIKVVGTTTIPGDARLPLYDTVISTVLNLAKGQVLNGALPGTELNIPNLANLKLDLVVGEPPTVVVGPARQDENGNWITRFQAADVSLGLTSKIDLLGGLLVVDLPLAVKAGGGDGALVWASCAAGVTNSVKVGIDVDDQAATVATGYINNDGNIDREKIELAVLSNTLPGGISLASITADLDLTLGGGTEPVQLGYDLSGGKPSAIYTKGGLSDADFKALDVEVKLLANEDEGCKGLFGCIFKGLGDVINGIVNGVTDILGLEDLIKSTVSGLVESLGTTVIDPLFNALGVSLGTTKIEITGATQNHVQLLEYCGPNGC